MDFDPASVASYIIVEVVGSDVVITFPTPDISGEFDDMHASEPLDELSPNDSGVFRVG